MKNIVILVSGRGSNMISIAQACSEQRWPARIAAVISSKPGAPALEAAVQMGLPTRVLDPREHADRASFDAELGGVIETFGADLVVLAGYMRILTDAFVDRFAGRLVNIHPSLLPAFPGLHPHRQALNAGVKLHGATVHMVTRELDSGPILVQGAVPVLPDDDEAALAARVLKLEHRIYPQAIRWLVEDRLQPRSNGIWLDDATRGPQALACLGPEEMENA